MTRICVELDYEQIDDIVQKELRANLERVRNNIKNIEDGSVYHNPSDKKLYRKEEKALKRILKMYTIPSEWDTI